MHECGWRGMVVSFGRRPVDCILRKLGTRGFESILLASLKDRSLQKKGFQVRSSGLFSSGDLQ